MYFQKKNKIFVTKKHGSGSIWIRIFLALLDPDPDRNIVKVLDPDPYIEYTDPQHWIIFC